MRFPEAELIGKTLKEMMGMEGLRIRRLYAEKAKEYNLIWGSRNYVPGKFELSDLTNKILTAANAALYALLTSAVMAMGYSPHAGFIHSGSPLPFIYDMADLYKEHLCIDTAFSLTFDLAGNYDKERVSDAFRRRVIESDLLGRVGEDIKNVLNVE
jgi:CRISPR-associated protein Cas1